MVRAACVLCLLAVLSGCTAESIYSSLQATQRDQCMTYPEGERERCLEAADTSYESYEQQR
jgi:hypothetical protein